MKYKVSFFIIILSLSSLVFASEDCRKTSKFFSLLIKNSVLIKDCAHLDQEIFKFTFKGLESGFSLRYKCVEDFRKTILIETKLYDLEKDLKKKNELLLHSRKNLNEKAIACEKGIQDEINSQISD